MVTPTWLGDSIVSWIDKENFTVGTGYRSGTVNAFNERQSPQFLWSRFIKFKNTLNPKKCLCINCFFQKKRRHLLIKMLSGLLLNKTNNSLVMKFKFNTQFKRFYVFIPEERIIWIKNESKRKKSTKLIPHVSHYFFFSGFLKNTS